MALEGSLLVATPLIGDPNFFHTVVYLYAYEAEVGAAGVVVNRSTDEPAVSHLPEWRSCLAAPPNVFWGGPVAQDSGVVLVVEDGQISVAEDLSPPGGRVRARLFVGQAGWGPGQLEGEVGEGAWLVLPADPATVMAPFPESAWSTLLRRTGGRAAVWATHPMDARLN